jgi:hypothetical protein
MSGSNSSFKVTAIQIMINFKEAQKSEESAAERHMKPVLAVLSH